MIEYFVAGLLAGFVLGVAASIIYLRWRMHRQLGDIQEQMEMAMDLNEEVSEMFTEDANPEEAEEEKED